MTQKAKDKQILDSWKEIAQHLNRTVRTCQNWEQSYDLPIHRLDGSPKARVFAYREELDRWLEKMLHEREFTQKSTLSSFLRKRRALSIATLVLIVLIVSAVIIWRIIPGKEAIQIPSNQPSLVVLYFENISGDESLEGWRTGLSDLMITDLSQSKYINVLTGDKVYSILKKLDLLEAKKFSTEELIKIAKEGRVVYVATGGLIKAGEKIIINLVVQRPHTGEVIRPMRVECRNEEDIIAKVDELTRQVKLDLNFSQKQLISDIDGKLGEITTSSSEAFKYYSEGRKYMRMLEHRKSLHLMENAIAIDPEFAMAYRSMAMAYGELGYYAERKKCIEKAFKFSNRLPQREKYTIQGDFYRQSERTYSEAINAYTKLLEAYPYDLFGNNGLGVLYLGLEEWDKALERFEVLVEKKNERIVPYLNIVHVLRRQGLLEKAEKFIEDHLNDFSDMFVFHGVLAQIYLSESKYDQALYEVDKALFLAPGHVLLTREKGRIYLCKGDFKKAEEEFQKLIKSEEKSHQIEGIYHLASLCLTQGRFKESKNQLEHAIETAAQIGNLDDELLFHLSLSSFYLRLKNYTKALEESNKAWNIAVEKETLTYQKTVLFVKAHILIEMGLKEEAKKTAYKLKEMIEQGLNKKLIRMHYHLSGMMEFKENNLSEAIKYFEKSITLLPFPYYPGSMYIPFVEPLASAYFKAGDFNDARKEYEKITSLTTGRLHYGDVYSKSFYMLGKIYEQQGQWAKAIENYEKFLDLWKDADPDIPEIDDAKKRLNGLKASHLNKYSLRKKGDCPF